MARSAPILLIAFGILLGVRMYAAFHTEPALSGLAGRTAVVAGVVADDPDVRAASVRVVLEVSGVNGEPGEGKVLAVLPRGEEVSYGDALEVRGVLDEPRAFETATGRTFDYPGYLRVRGISLVMQHATLRAQEEGNPSLLRGLFSVKHAFERALERVMRPPQSGLMEGFLLGEKSGLSQSLTQAFVATGLIHVVVLSGYNIGVVAEWTVRLLSTFLRRRAALVVAGIVIVLFATMAGGGMATVRAVVMGLIALLARYLNRPAAALRALAFATCTMLLWNPLVLLDVGFVLSILATFGLVTISPWMESKLSFMPQGGMRDAAATTLSVQLFVLPALLYYTGVLSLVALPLNALVLPLVPLSMLLGFVAGMLALVHPVLGLLPGLIADALLGGIIWATERAASLPLSYVVVPAFPAWMALLCYAPLSWFAIARYARSAPR